MSKTIVCLGYHLNPDGSPHHILQNRLKDTVIEITKNPHSTLMLMGGSLYRETDSIKISEAETMKKYLENNFSGSLKNIKILTEENSTSTIEQLFFLKENVPNILDLTIVSSEFFGNRVKLYAEYIFGTTDGVTFIESRLPEDVKEKFKEVETDKLKKAVEWLKNNKKGDSEKILEEQRAFQNKIKKGKVSHPIS